jgi:hypothetical protein
MTVLKTNKIRKFLTSCSSFWNEEKISKKKPDRSQA